MLDEKNGFISSESSQILTLMLDTNKFRTKQSFRFKVPRELGSKGNLDFNLSCALLFLNFPSYKLWFGLWPKVLETCQLCLLTQASGLNTRFLITRRRG